MGLIGTRVHHYRVEAKLGEGGMGEVYLAHDERAHRRVALKFLSRRAAAQAEARRRLEREARAAAALDTAHIVDVYEVGEFDGRPFFAMPFVEGEVVSELCARAPLAVDRALDIARQAASGLLPDDTSLMPRDDCRLDRLNQALERLQALTPLLKSPVVDACAFAVTADNKVQVPQAELLRVICTLLDCPMPPLFDSAA